VSPQPLEGVRPHSTTRLPPAPGGPRSWRCARRLRRRNSRLTFPPPQRPQVFHAGTSANEHGDVVAAGGRVLGVSALGSDVAEAQKRAYEGVAAIDWDGGFYRKDIGWRAVARLRAGSKEGAARR
jgi:hypothetical protein